MKKIFLIFGLCLFSLTHAAKNPNRPVAVPSKPLTDYEDSMREVYDFLGWESYGFHALKESTQTYINAIIHELGMDDYCIEMRGMSNMAQHAMGRMNAFVVPSIFGGKSHAWMFISEEWFESLSDGEKQGLVRHELMHIKCNHVPKKVLFFLLTVALTLPVCNWSSNVMDNPADNRKVAAFASYIAAIGGFLLANAQFSQFCEKEADVQAAKTMKDKQGIIDLFVNFKDHTEDPDSRFFVKRFIAKISKLLWMPFTKLGELYGTHPTFDQRIAYLKAL